MSDKNQNDKFFKELADRYIEIEGSRLNEERKGLPNYSTPQLDRKVRRQTFSKRKTHFVGIGIAAACALLVLILSPLSKQSPPPSLNAYETPVQGKLIPIGFTLPSNFVVTEEKLDREESIYTLKNMQMDDVILSLKESDDSFDIDGLTEIRINGQTAYAREAVGYKLLIIKTDDFIYTLSCRYELETLITLGDIIL